MLITCPICECKSRIATSKPVTAEVREAYCQCINLNCGTLFVVFISVARIIEPKKTKPDPLLQPELCKNPDQMDLLEPDMQPHFSIS
ncbi:ogr/Delta-like zinc finger family protein [Vibrio sp. OPT18]|uniref:ogr/Delta-like zinc finger family protein n=1 Tax=Vibrio sp. OPT18 TaxID=2778641 RepID=UPI00187FED1E|nr:ogr/Delta-like zinc finger family protein [Vibrio sp. OPT18]MBE8578669.1 ogr/Delta-like zinc finger family protein [Vibrio sp. OPT18]